MAQDFRQVQPTEFCGCKRWSFIEAVYDFYETGVRGGYMVSHAACAVVFPRESGCCGSSMSFVLRKLVRLGDVIGLVR